MRHIRAITTEEVRDAYQGRLIKTGENAFELVDEAESDAEFDMWLVTERKRVAELAISKERNRIIGLLTKEISRVSNPMLVDREYLDGLEEAIALIGGEGQ